MTSGPYTKLRQSNRTRSPRHYGTAVSWAMRNGESTLHSTPVMKHDGIVFKKGASPALRRIPLLDRIGESLYYDIIKREFAMCQLREGLRLSV